MSAITETEMEEGEIVDDLSDISSEEEFLLRQRLEVLENYNNVLERKKAKRSSNVPGKGHKKVYTPIPDLSEISATDLEDNYNSHKNIKQFKHIKRLHCKQRKKDLNKKNAKNTKKKSHHNKKRTEFVIPETSDESEDEYRNKRIKLANAVNVNGNKIDKSSLSVRLKKMICSSMSYQPVDCFITNNKQLVFENNNRLEEQEFHPITPINAKGSIIYSEEHENIPTKEVIKNLTNFSGFVDVCSDNHIKIDDSDQPKVDNFTVIDLHKNSQSVINVEDDSVDTIGKNEKENVNTKISSDIDSDEDLELLRQNVLKTKAVKTKICEDHPTTLKYSKNLSDDEDSDTAELRLICLRSALLKKAIEIKQKQKLQKRLSQSSIIQDELLDEANIYSSKNESKNNTDIESVDMDIGSDEDVKINEEEHCAELVENNANQKVLLEKQNDLNEKQYLLKVDEIEEDEDLLRAKLLTSLSKNLPNIISPIVVEEIKNISSDKIKQPVNLPKNATEEKKFIIELGESDSEGEHEATKNLTKMHMKLSEQIDFQQKLDLFLKSTRMEVENSKDSVVIQEQLPPKKTEKFVAKAVNNLPKSEQIEYKNLVKRMAELERIKQSRQSSIGIMNKVPVNVKDKLKQHNVSNISTAVHNNLEEHISTSRKKIAEESAKMLKLKEEAKKLSQKYKIVATELRNITTAITLNKKQQKSVQNCLTKIRLQHQNLLKSSTALKHSKSNGHAIPTNTHSKIMNVTKSQKEYDPSKTDPKKCEPLRTVKVSILQDDKEKANIKPNFSIQVKFTTDNKASKSPVKHGIVDSKKHLITNEQDYNKTEEKMLNVEETNDVVNNDIINKDAEDNYKQITVCNKRYKSFDDYQSPLQALGITNWEADPNAILCPFEIAGECKDSDCKYLHTKVTQ